jgi:uncharacterized delta-60 repeat protein
MKLDPEEGRAMGPEIETFKWCRASANVPVGEDRLRRRGVQLGRRHLALPVVVVWVLTASLAGVAGADAGDLDPTFGLGGKVTTGFVGGAAAWSVAIQLDGKIVAAGGSAGKFGLARYDIDGSLDTTFNGSGKVTTDFSAGDDIARGVAVQADGKIVAVGQANFRRFAIARYKTDGTLDATFSDDGKVKTNFTPGGDIANGIAIQENGKIVAVGHANSRRFAIARYKADGTLDTTFGGDGKVTTRFAGFEAVANGVAVQSDGRIVAAGELPAGNGFALARYRADGSLDPRFSGDGKAITQFADGFGGGARAVAVQSNGKIVAAGTAGDIFGPFALVRYTDRGRLDTTFGGDGKITANMGDGEESATGVAIQANGKIVVAGYAGVPHEGGDPGMGFFALARFRTDGALDPTFGGDGKVRTRFAVGLTLAMSVAIQANGRIVAAGWAGNRFGLARYRYLS